HWFQPALAGLIIGVIGTRFPEILGAGYTYIDQAMHEQFTWQVLLILGALKILGTGLSFSSGTPGGLFAPVLFMGAMIGGAVGIVEQRLFPHLAITVGAYALVGMGTLFVGILRAPMTSVFMMLEVSGNYTIIVPVIISNAIAYVISRTFEPTPTFDMLSRQDGIDLPSLEEERETPLLRVENAMRSPISQLLTSDMSIRRAQEQVKGSSQEFFLVGMGSGDWRGVGRTELMGMRASEQPLRSELPHHVPYLHPDFTLDTALRLMRGWPLVPVVHRADLQRLLGVLGLDDIVRAYRGAGISEAIAEEPVLTKRTG
ncbi:MAG: chloride channel protein, partial [Candidatus Eremiobacteraeota bacterium]|nr:chloride channel protein [Candidatus Eremiobacteraeota bacterium]